MSIFDIFRSKAENQSEEPQVHFGRYSDAYKDSVKYVYFEDALVAFENENYLESISLLLDYLRHDDQDNIQYTMHEGEILFELLQGSKKILGRADQDRFVALAEIAQIDEANIGFLRRLLDKNYLLKYCKFCINENQVLTLKFDSFILDASPKKLFHALKELAIQSDKHDDILVDEFDELFPIHTGQIKALEEQVQDVKYQYLVAEIEVALKYAEENSRSMQKSTFGVSYVLLYLNYKLDYLVKPEAYVMELLELNHRTYFAKDNKSPEDKNAELISQFKKILERSEDQLKSELYDCVHTFGMTKASPHIELVTLINSELDKINWYVQNKQQHIAQVIPPYIAAYALFNFGFSKPATDLLALLIRIFEQDYFIALGFPDQFIKNGKLQKKEITQKINAIKEKNLELFPLFNPNLEILVFHDKIHFGIQFLLMIRDAKID